VKKFDEPKREVEPDQTEIDIRSNRVSRENNPNKNFKN
jgi:hypothetical protein